MDGLFDDMSDENREVPLQESNEMEIIPEEIERLCKILTEESCSFFLLTSLSGEDILLKLSNGEDSWSGRLTANNRKEIARSAHMNEADHFRDTLQALRQEGSRADEFVYSTKVKENGDLELSWKKYLREEDIKFQLGTITLRSSIKRSKTNCELLDFAVRSIVDLQAEVSASKAEKQRLIVERASILQKLEERVNLKEDLEKDLYGKFKIVLNAKKTKIRALMEQINELLDENAQLQQNLKTKGPTDPISQPSSSHKKSSTQYSDSESDTDMGERSGEELFQTPTDLPGPSLLDDDQVDSYSPPVKRTRRRDPSSSTTAAQQQQPKPKTQPLPKKKSSKGKSSKSKDTSMCSEDLLDML